jgi:hypothetical protein
MSKATGPLVGAKAPAVRTAPNNTSDAQNAPKYARQKADMKNLPKLSDNKLMPFLLPGNYLTRH